MAKCVGVRDIPNFVRVFVYGVGGGCLWELCRK